MNEREQAIRAAALEEAAEVARYFADKWKRIRDAEEEIDNKLRANERWDASATIAERIRALAAPGAEQKETAPGPARGEGEG